MSVNTMGRVTAADISETRQRLRALLRTEGSILNKCIMENRVITAGEQKDLDGLKLKIEQAEDEIDRFESRRALNERTRENAIANADTSGERLISTGGVFGSFGEQLQAIANAGIPGTDIDRRLYQLAPSGMGEAVSSDGGFLVQSEFANEILRRSYNVGEVAKRCRKIPVGNQSANGLVLPRVDESSRATGSRWGGIQVYRAAEAATVAATKPKMGRLEMKLEKLMGLCYVTDELLQDVPAMENFVTEGFAEEISYELDDEIVRGSGAGQCLGLLNAGATVQQAAVGGQAVDTILIANISGMWARCWGRSQQNAVWFINQDILPQLFQLSLTIGTGGVPVFLPPSGAAGSPFATLYGRPVIPIEQCSTLGDVGDVILADLSQYLLIDRPMSTAWSMHVRFIYDEMAFRITYRVNGQPLWASALTPANSASTVSPFVTLAAR